VTKRDAAAALTLPVGERDHVPDVRKIVARAELGQERRRAEPHGRVFGIAEIDRVEGLATGEILKAGRMEQSRVRAVSVP